MHRNRRGRCLLMGESNMPSVLTPRIQRGLDKLCSRCEKSEGKTSLSCVCEMGPRNDLVLRMLARRPPTRTAARSIAHRGSILHQYDHCRRGDSSLHCGTWNPSFLLGCDRRQAAPNGVSFIHCLWLLPAPGQMDESRRALAAQRQPRSGRRRCGRARQRARPSRTHAARPASRQGAGSYRTRPRLVPVS